MIDAILIFFIYVIIICILGLIAWPIIYLLDKNNLL